MSTMFWLIQRGRFHKNLQNVKGLLGGDLNNLVYPDYMGSAEFEFGAIPKAYRRIMANIAEYELVELPFKTIRGVPIYLYCRKDRKENIVKGIQLYLENRYHLKEFWGFEAHFSADRDYELQYARKSNFYWCIDRKEFGDWMLFIGATDRKNAFLKVVHDDYYGWWLKKSEEEREEEIKEALKRW